MKNLFKIRKTKIYLGIITSAVFTMAIALFANFKPSLFRNASAVNDYTITFNRDNGGTGFPSSYGSGTNSSGHTNKGNPISFAYSNAKSTSSKFCTLANGGYLYNSTVLTGLESVEVKFTGGSLSLYSSKSTTFDGDAESLTTESALTIAANYDYFKLVASGETAIEYIKVFYTCSAREEESYYVKVNETSQVTSGQYLIVYEDGSKALNLQTAVDQANNGASVTISNDQIESTSTTDSYAFTLDGTNKSLLAPCGQYITHTGSSNTLNFSSTAVGHNIDVTDGVASIYVSGTNYFLKFNADSTQNRFRYYKTGFSNIALYKLNGESGGGTVVTNYTITYNSNGGTGTMEPTSGTNPVVASCTFTAPSGQEFSKWNTAANGSGTDVAVGTALSADTTLYAIWVASSSGGSSTFELFSGTIEEGDYVITYNGEAMNTTVTSSRLQYDSVTPVNDVITDPEDTIIWHIAKSGNYWTLYNAEADAYAASTGAKNQAQMLSDGTDDKAKWTITGSSTYDFENLARSTATTNPGNKWLRKNGTYGFACYASTTGGELTLYKSVEATPQGPISVSGVSLNHVSAEITNETGIQLSATISPSNATNQNVSWSSDKPGIASVDQSGNVTGVSAGTAIITVTTEDGDKTATCEVTVTTIVHVTGVSLNHASLDLHPGEQGNLTATVSPSNASNKNVTWSTNASSVATVNNGTVTAVSAGTATITVTTVDGSKTATCTVTVTNIAVTGITLNKNSLTLNRPGSETLTATVSPSNASNKNINWSSANTNVATVNGGTVTAVGTGTTTITATSAADNTKYATCTVTVNPVNVSSVSLNKNALSLGVGAKETLTATVSPSNADNTNINWSTSDSGVATVSNGEVTGVAAGTATITARSAADNTKYATCSVTVTQVTDCTIDLTAQGFENSQDVTTVTKNSFTLTFSQASGNNAPKYYTSGDSVRTYANNTLNVATSGSDKITKIVFTTGSDTSTTLTTDSGSFDSSTKTWTGSATSITFTNGSSGRYYYKTVTITVTPSAPVQATGVNLPATYEIGNGDTKQLNLTYSPSNANTGLAVTWSKVSGSNKISVDSSGNVSVDSTATSSDTAIIRVTLDSNSNYDECTITVTEIQKDDWTLLFYVCGADLESKDYTGTEDAGYGYNGGNIAGYASQDIDEIISVRNQQPDNVNIILETGGATQWARTDLNSHRSNLARWEITKSQGLHFLREETYAGMGISSTFQQFLEWGIQTYPAYHYGVFMWNHGGALDGCCFDEKANDNPLTAREVATAVSGAKQTCGLSKNLDFIAYDACLMAVQDIAEINSHYFDYMVCSQETEYAGGYDYDAWLPTLYKNPSTVSTETICTKIAKTFMDEQNGDAYSWNNASNHHYQPGDSNYWPYDQTQSVLDLTKMSAYKSAFDSLSTSMMSTCTSWSTVRSRISSARSYGEGYYNIYDVVEALDAIKSSYSSLSTQIDTVKTKLADMVVFEEHGTDISGCGLCLYCPVSKLHSKSYYSGTTNFTNWYNFLAQTNFGNWK